MQRSRRWHVALLAAPRSSRPTTRTTALALLALSGLSLLAPLRSATAARIVQIPDIHADLATMKKALSMVEPISPSDRIVFTGDFVDRGTDPRGCYELSERLAESHTVTRLTGNHEWVNLMGVGPHDTFARYVPKEDLGSFGGWPEREHSFSPEGDMGKLIRQGFDVIAVEELPSDPRTRTLFVHAGISSRTMKRYGSVEAIKAAGKKMLLENNLETDLLNEILQTRHLAQGQESQVCPEVEEILRTAGAERIALGHTPTQLLGHKEGGPLVRCGGRLLLTDVAMSQWMGGGVPSVLTIETDEATGKLARIFFQHGQGEVLEVPILEPLNDYRSEL